MKHLENFRDDIDDSYGHNDPSKRRIIWLIVTWIFAILVWIAFVIFIVTKHGNS